jgi:pimeloyl-ACP methyl ester carboxylesterase
VARAPGFEILDEGNAGEGCIIFVHGLGGSHRAFRKDAAALGDRYRVVRYYLVGHGAERGVAAEFTVDALVAQLSEVHSTVADAPVHLCSLSYGCYITTLFAARHPDRVASLCHIGGHYNNPSRLFDVYDEFWARRHEPYEHWIRDYAEAINPVEPGVPRFYAVTSRTMFQKSVESLHPSRVVDSIGHRLSVDLKAAIVEVGVPTLWAVGEYDLLYRSPIYDLAEVAPNAQFAEIKRAGHAANHFRPREFQACYSAFLEGTRR